MIVLAALRDLAALVASFVVIYGVNTWRRDFVGKRKIEMAEETLCLFYRAKDAVRAMRSPMAYGEESDHIIRNDNESPAMFTARRTVAPLYKRYENHTELFAALHSTRYQFMARFGNSAGEPFDDLQKLVNDVLRAGRMLILTADHRDEANDVDQRKRSFDQRRKYELVIWDHAQDDEINMRLSAVVESIETICRRTIDSPPVWVGQWRRTNAWLQTHPVWKRICDQVSSWRTK